MIFEDGGIHPFPLELNTHDIIWAQVCYEWHSIEMDERKTSGTS